MRAAEKAPIADAAITADVSLHKQEVGFKLGVELHVEMSGVDQATAEKLVEAAHQVCPYSNATRGNIDVELDVTRRLAGPFRAKQQTGAAPEPGTGTFCYFAVRVTAGDLLPHRLRDLRHHGVVRQGAGVARPRGPRPRP